MLGRSSRTPNPRWRSWSFLREAWAGAALHMMAGLEAFDPEGEAIVVQTLIHSHSGETAATFRTRLAPLSATDERQPPWPAQAQARADTLMIETPVEARERGVSPRPDRLAADLDRALRLRLTPGARGAVTAADCDASGQMRYDIVMARITDAMPHLDPPIRAAAARDRPGMPDTIGGASIEFRLAYIARPPAGSPLVLYSGLAASGSKVHNLVHWLLDPRTGHAYASAEMVMVMFDLEARKAIAIGPEGQKTLGALVVPGLTM